MRTSPAQPNMQQRLLITLNPKPRPYYGICVNRECGEYGFHRCSIVSCGLLGLGSWCSNAAASQAEMATSSRFPIAISCVICGQPLARVVKTEREE